MSENDFEILKQDEIGPLDPKDNKEGETILTRALKITKDPKQIRDLIGVQRVADVLNTLDGIAIRKEYHSSLIRHGVDFDYLITGIKAVADDKTEKGKTRLNALNMLLKSIGIDKFSVPAGGGGSGWEDELMKRLEAERSEVSALPCGEERSVGPLESSVVETIDIKIPEYDPAVGYKVTSPKMPEKVLAQKQREDLISGSNV